MVGKVRISIEVEGGEVEATRTSENVLEFAEVPLPSGTTVKAKAYKAPMGVVVLHFNFSDMLEPQDVKHLEKYAVEKYRALTNKFGKIKVLVISGRMPIWAYIAIAHAVLHLAPAIATLDPKLHAAVVVASHNKMLEEGEIVELPQDLVSELLS